MFMRLIDAEPIEKAIDEWLLRETKDPVTLTIVDNVGTWVTHAPTVEAIPVKWLLKKMQYDISNLDTITVVKIGRLIREWRKENETD